MRLFSTIILLTIGLNVLADHKKLSHDFEKDTVVLEQVVVTGTRTPKVLANTPIPTRVITREDIARTDATDIQDLLQQEIPGVEFSYAMNQQTHLNFAGFGGQSILFLVDGERLAGETMDDVDFSRLVTTGVERVEIAKGAASALYGSNAAGGVVNIITRKPTNPWQIHADSRWSKHHGQRYSIEADIKKKYWSNTISAAYNSIDNYTVKNGSNPSTRVISEVYGGKTYNFRDKCMVNVTDDLHLTGRLGYGFRQVARTQNEPERYRGFSAGLKGDWTISKNDYMELSYAFDQYDKSIKQEILNLDIRTYSNVQNCLRALYNHTNERGDILTAGGDMMRDYLKNIRLSGEERHQYTYDAFVQYDWNINEKWELVGALRYDYFSDGCTSQFTPKLSARYLPQRNISLRMGYGMGFRAPSLKEKYSEFDMAGIWIVEGNQDLRSEVSHNLNASIEYVKGRYSLMAMGYYNNVRDKISTGIPYYTADTGSQLKLPYINLEHYDVFGIELSANRKWNNVYAKFGYTYTYENHPKDNNDNTINNQYIPARPHALNWAVTFNKEFSSNYAISATLSGRYLSSVNNEEYRDYYDISKGTTTIHYPAYSLWKLSIVQQLWEKAKVTIAIDNLINYKPDYYYLNAPVTDGMNVMVGFSIDLF